MNVVSIALEQSFLLLPLVLGIYLSYSIVKVTDLTVDGSFVLGAAVFARSISESFSLVVSMFLALIAGAACGVFVALIQRKDRIKPLIAGVLMVLMLQSINLQVLGRPNISVYGYKTLVNLFDLKGINLIISLMASVLSFVLIFSLLRSRFGLSLRGLGENKVLLGKLGINPELRRMSALALSNSLAAGCGALSAQVYGYADVSMGYGVALTAIGAVIIGSHIVKFFSTNSSFNLIMELAGVFLGTLVYFVIINIFLSMGLDPTNLKLLLGVVLICFLSAIGGRKND